MPTKSKSRTNSRKSTASAKSAQSNISVTADDDFGNIIIKVKPTSIKKTTPNNASSPRPEFLEPLSPTPSVQSTAPWDLVGMTEADFTAMQARVHKQMAETMCQDYVRNLLADLKNPSFWYQRIDRLETEREYFNKKRGWSALDVTCVEKIDQEIKECEQEIDALCAEEDRVEYEYD